MNLSLLEEAMRRSPKKDRVPDEKEVLFCKVMGVYSRTGYTKAQIKQAKDLARIMLYPKQSNAFIVALDYGGHTLCTAAALAVLIYPGREPTEEVKITRSADINEEYFDD